MFTGKYLYKLFTSQEAFTQFAYCCDTNDWDNKIISCPSLIEYYTNVDN